MFFFFFFFSSRRRHTRYIGDWSSDVCSSDLLVDIVLQFRCLIIDVDVNPSENSQIPVCSGQACGKRLEAWDWGLCCTWRSEERRVGKECRYGRSGCDLKKR